MMRYGNRIKQELKRLGGIALRILIIDATMILIWLPSVFAGEKLVVGVAANFMLPFEDMADVFEQETSVKVEPTFTSSGNLYGQIINGAPYDFFISADEARPKILFGKGLAEKPFIYARGRVVLWALQKELCEAGNWRGIVVMPKVKRLAIANPETAPYGTASVTALKSAGLWPAVEQRLVYAQTIAQAFQYAHTGAVDAGFCAYSSTFSDQGRRGCFYFVEEAPDVIQAACVLRRTRCRGVADRFAAFLLSPRAEEIKRRYGYQ